MEKKVLVVTNVLPHYRIPIFNLLSKKYDLTVSYSLGNVDQSKEIDFEIFKIPVTKINRFFIHTSSLHTLCKNFDVVIGLGDISWLSIMGLLFKKKKYKVILWGIGLRASYKNQFGKKTIWDTVRFYLFKKADGLLFYSDKPIPIYIKKGFNQKNLFVANNTVEVYSGTEKNYNNSLNIKNTLIFIGTLYKEKKIYELLECYEKVKKRIDSVPLLNIVGDGEEFDNIKSWIEKRNYQDTIILHGKIIDEKVLSELFKKAFACISPGQAGLSVLKSMGYGVPFITKRNAITGGEIFNIINEYSGILYDTDDELINIIYDISFNRKKYVVMGENAKAHYNRYRTPQRMVNDFVNAIEGVLMAI